MPRHQSVHVPMKNNAAIEYAAARKRVDERIREVQKLLHRHANRATAQPTNRALVDELLHIGEMLGETIQFLGSSQEEQR